jgi:hypothetical protein
VKATTATITVLLLFLSVCCSAHADQIRRDEKGGQQEKIATSASESEKFYDSSGVYQGKAEKRGGKYWFYDRSGNVTGSTKTK